jgi:hypothetical protein
MVSIEMGFPLISHAATLSVSGGGGGGEWGSIRPKINGKIIVSLCAINNAFNALSAKVQANDFILICE